MTVCISAGRRFFLVLLIIAWLITATAAAVSAQPDQLEIAGSENPTVEQIATWINQLGDDDFHTRQAAEQNLQRSGDRAAAALKDALDKADYEQQLRIKRLLAKLEQIDDSNLLERFVDGKIELPGWILFSDLATDSEENRHAFVALYQRHSDWLKRIQAGPENISEFYNTYPYAISQNSALKEYHFAIHSMLAAHYVKSKEATTKHAKRRRSLARQMVTSLYLSYGKDIIENAGQFAELNKAALTLWLTHNDGSPSTWKDQLRLACVTKQESGIHIARTVLDSAVERTLSDDLIAEALEIMYLYADESDLNRLASQLDNERRAFRGSFNNKGKKQNYKSLLCDMALAATLRIHGIHPRDYGFIGAEDRSTGTVLDDRQRFGFPDNERREKAFAKWNAESAKLDTTKQSTFSLPNRNNQ